LLERLLLGQRRQQLLDLSRPQCTQQRTLAYLGNDNGCFDDVRRQDPTRCGRLSGTEPDIRISGQAYGVDDV